MHLLSLPFALFFPYFCSCCRAGTQKMPSHSFPAFPHGAILTFHINFCFLSQHLLPNPSSCISDNSRCWEQSRDSTTLSAPASPPRLALLQEHQELQNQHSACYTLGQSPGLNFYLFSSGTATSKQGQSLCRCPSCSSSPPRMCMSDPLAPLINLALSISPGKLWPQISLS